jgi:hypothetical protein
VVGGKDGGNLDEHASNFADIPEIAAVIDSLYSFTDGAAMLRRESGSSRQHDRCRAQNGRGESCT